jgi:glycosyltransferase involved in cell wall biosynthesis
MSTPSPDILTAAPFVDDDTLFALANAEHERRIAVSKALARHSLSVVLPTFNEEQAIRATLVEITAALDDWGADYEVIVVNDGSRDRTEAVDSDYAARHPRVRVVTHATNQGYGAALSTGFAAASKDLTFFMDSDGQFTIGDLPRLLVHIDSVDAVLGYRVRRQDSPMRHLNARGWSALTRLTLGVRARDLDCAFKLFRTEFVHTHPPTTGGALVNAELLHALRLSGGVYREVGVRHLPRNGGRATGANARVILRALRDLAAFTWRQRRRAA